MPEGDRKTATSEEVLVLDSSTFIKEMGLMSRQGSALKHYLYSKGIQLIVPEVVAEECERHLTDRAMEKRKKIQDELEWLARYLGKVNGWSAPSDDKIEERAKALAAGEGLGAIVLAETDDVRRRAELRDQAERPPSHLRQGRADCKIWEHCLDLLADHDVVLVSADKDFRGHRKHDDLHPLLRAESEKIGTGRKLAFHRNIESLLSDLKSEIPPIPNDVIFAFVYDAISDAVQELESNSGCRPKSIGTVRQTRFTTEVPGVIEVRLEVEDTWESADGATSLNFQLSGSCHYHLRRKGLANLKADVVQLLTTEPDGSVRAVKGSRVTLRAGTIYMGAPPIQPERGPLE